MEPLEYILEFNMLSRESNYNRIDFLNALYEDFTRYTQYYLKRYNIDNLNYKEWSSIVSNYYQKFMAIAKLRKSLRSDGEGLTKQLWGYFYINYLVPDRDKLFPHQAKAIYQYKRNQFRHLQDKNNNNEIRQGNPRPTR